MKLISESILNPIAIFLSDYMNWYLIVLLFFTVNFLFGKWMQIIMQKELKKRQEVMEELKPIRDHFLHEAQTKENAVEKGIEEKTNNVVSVLEKKSEENQEKIEKMAILKETIRTYAKESAFLQGFHLQKELADDQLDDIKSQSKEVIVKHRSHPYLLILAFLLPIFLFITLIFYMRTLHTIPFLPIMPLLLAILTFFTFVTRKTIWFFLIMSIMGWFFYRYNTGAANLFLGYSFVTFFIAKRIIMPIKLKIEEKKKDKEK